MFTLISINRNVPITGETLLVFGIGTPTTIPASLDADGKETSPSRVEYSELRNVLLRATDHTTDESDLVLEEKARIAFE